jgi:hypothetical protein
VGLARRDAFFFFTDYVLVLRSAIDFKAAGIAVTRDRLFTAAHPMESLAAERDLIQAAGGSFDDSRSLALDPSAQQLPELQPFFTASPAPAGGTVMGLRFTYREIEYGVDAPAQSLLFLKDSYFPYWTAEVDGRPVPVVRALHHFKAVPVPAGRSRVRLRFTPPGIALGLGVSYLLLLGVAVAWIRTRRALPAAPRGVPSEA